MHDAAFTPALMGEGDAAFYIGVSASTIRTLKIPRKVFGKRRLYDRRDLGSGGQQRGKLLAFIDPEFSDG